MESHELRSPTVKLIVAGVLLLVFTLLVLASPSFEEADADVPVSYVDLNRSSLSFTSTGASEGITLKATVYPSDATNKNVMWSSSDTTVATVSQSGFVTPTGNGNAIITVTTEDGGYTDTCNVSVHVPLKSITMSQSTLTLGNDKTSQYLWVIFNPTDAEDQQITWSTSNSGVATVSSSGNVKAINSGTAIITATSHYSSSIKATCTVTVNYAVTGVTLDVTKLDMTDDDPPRTLKATIHPTNATNQKVYWSSDNTDVATVDSNGAVTPRSGGVANITVTTDDGGKTATCKVTVIETVRGEFKFYLEDELLETIKYTKSTKEITVPDYTGIMIYGWTDVVYTDSKGVKHHEDAIKYLPGDKISTSSYYQELYGIVPDGKAVKIVPKNPAYGSLWDEEIDELVRMTGILTKQGLEPYVYADNSFKASGDAIKKYLATGSYIELFNLEGGNTHVQIILDGSSPVDGGTVFSFSTNSKSSEWNDYGLVKMEMELNMTPTYLVKPIIVKIHQTGNEKNWIVLADGKPLSKTMVGNTSFFELYYAKKISIETASTNIVIYIPALMGFFLLVIFGYGRFKKQSVVAESNQSTEVETAGEPAEEPPVNNETKEETSPKPEKESTPGAEEESKESSEEESE